MEVCHETSGRLTFISSGQPNARVCAKSLASLWFVVPNIWEFEDDCHRHFTYTFHLAYA